MIEELNYDEEMKEQLLQEVTSMKKQSVLFLSFAFIGLIAIAFLIIKLRETNTDLSNAKKKVAQQNDSLEFQNEKITKLKNELDDWRISMLKLDSIPAPVEPEAIVVLDEVAIDVAPGPIIKKPTLPVWGKKFPAKPPHIGGKSQAKQVEAQASPSAAIQAPPKPLIVMQAQTKHYAQKKHEGVSKTPLFGYIIYIQDAEKGEASTDLQKILKEKGAIVPAIQSQNLPAEFRTSIKYFHQQDGRNAQGVKELMLRILRKNKIVVTDKDIPVTYVANAKVSLGQLEVWIGN